MMYRKNRFEPGKTAKIDGKDFSYRYYQNPKPEVNVTIVMLAGGSRCGRGTLAMMFNTDEYMKIIIDFMNGQEL